MTSLIIALLLIISFDPEPFWGPYVPIKTLHFLADKTYNYLARIHDYDAGLVFLEAGCCSALHGLTQSFKRNSRLLFGGNNKHDKKDKKVNRNYGL